MSLSHEFLILQFIIIIPLNVHARQRALVNIQISALKSCESKIILLYLNPKNDLIPRQTALHDKQSNRYTYIH